MLKSAVIEEKKFKHSCRVWADNPLGPKCLCQQEGLITMVICCKFKNSSTSDFIHIFSWIQPQVRGRQPQGTKFLCQQKPLVTSVICYKFKKKIFFAVWFYTIFFHDFVQVYSPGQGLTTPWACNFDVNRNILSLRSFVASFKKSLWSLILNKFFSWFIHAQYIVIGQGQTALMGQSFDLIRNVLLLHSFVASFKKLSLKSDFIQFFYGLIHVYSPGALQTDPRG